MWHISLLANDPDFEARVDLGLIEQAAIEEASGIAASRKNSGVLWIHNDSGSANVIYAVNTAGEHLGIFTIQGADLRDWEDIAIGPGPEDGEWYIYLGEIGDNDAQYPLKHIYRIKEPVVDSNQPPTNAVLTDVETITYQYEDGNRDAETLMIDPLTKDLYIITKREDSVQVYVAEYPQSLTLTLSLPRIATLGLQLIVGGDISSDGQEILIKSYTAVYYWCRTPQEALETVFSRSPAVVPVYQVEPQGEGICWQENSQGFYTVSEERQEIPARLYYYPRIVSNIASNTASNTALAQRIQLFQNYPNPFNPETQIRFQLQQAEYLELTIVDAAGKHIKTLFSGREAPGMHAINWNGNNERGEPVSSGHYYYRLKVGDFVETKQMILVR